MLGGVLFLSLLQAGCLMEPSLTITLGGDVILGREGQAIFFQDPWGGLSQADSVLGGSQNWFMVFIWSMHTLHSIQYNPQKVQS